jgi:hypothetical protein
MQHFVDETCACAVESKLKELNPNIGNLNTNPLDQRRRLA